MAESESLRFDPQQLASLKAAIQRNPQKILSETGIFLVRGLREYNTYIIRSPWRMGGGGGGGAPVAAKHGGNLRDTHKREITPFEARITPTSPYAKYVHEGTRKMEARPWLDFAQHAAEGAINQLAQKLLYNITKDLIV